MNFRRALRQAAAAAHAAGEITRIQLAQIRLVTLFRPEVCEELEACCLERAVAANEVASSMTAAAVNWDNLLDFLRKALAMVLEFIKLISNPEA